MAKQLELEYRRISAMEVTTILWMRYCQVIKKQYAANLIARGFQIDHIRTYGFAFCGKKVLIG